MYFLFIFNVSYVIGCFQMLLIKRMWTLRNELAYPVMSYTSIYCVILQPAIYVTSLAAVEVLRARDGGQQIIDSVDVTCGLSLGEYTALAFAGAFRFDIQFTNIVVEGYFNSLLQI